jgi:kinesin family member 6/9
MQVSFLEVYNDHLYDLLDITTSPEELVISEGSSGSSSTVVRGLKTLRVHSEAEALALLFEV